MASGLRSRTVAKLENELKSERERRLSMEMELKRVEHDHKAALKELWETILELQEQLAPPLPPRLARAGSQGSGIIYDFALEHVEGETTVARWRAIEQPHYQVLEAIEALQAGGKLNDMRYQHLVEGVFEMYRRENNNEDLRRAIAEHEETEEELRDRVAELEREKEQQRDRIAKLEKSEARLRALGYKTKHFSKDFKNTDRYFIPNFSGGGGGGGGGGGVADLGADALPDTSPVLDGAATSYDMPVDEVAPQDMTPEEQSAFIARQASYQGDRAGAAAEDDGSDGSLELDTCVACGKTVVVDYIDGSGYTISNCNYCDSMCCRECLEKYSTNEYCRCPKCVEEAEVEAE